MLTLGDIVTAVKRGEGWGPAWGRLKANQALKRNQHRFPGDFAFELTRDEVLGISQTVISLQKLRFSRSAHAFTEHGALKAANILNSPRAVAMFVYVIRALVKTGSSSRAAVKFFQVTHWEGR